MLTAVCKGRVCLIGARKVHSLARHVLPDMQNGDHQEEVERGVESNLFGCDRLPNCVLDFLTLDISVRRLVLNRSRVRVSVLSNFLKLSSIESYVRV